MLVPLLLRRKRPPFRGWMYSLVRDICLWEQKILWRYCHEVYCVYASASHELVWKAKQRGHGKTLSHCLKGICSWEQRRGRDNRWSLLVESWDHSLSTSMGKVCFGNWGVLCASRKRLSYVNWLWEGHRYWRKCQGPRRWRYSRRWGSEVGAEIRGFGSSGSKVMRGLTEGLSHAKGEQLWLQHRHLVS